MQNLPTSLPATEIPFNIDIVGLFTKQKYSGNFLVKVPLVSDMGKIGVEVARLCLGQRIEELPEETRLLFNAVAYLRVLLIDAPKWFSVDLEYGMKSVDPNIVMAIFEKANEKVEGWYAELNPKKEKDA